jgi:hypothetical protein
MQHSFTAPWIICLFLNVLPVETTLRVWDALFCDGVVALHRVGLALLRMKEQDLRECNEFVRAMQFLSSFPQGAFNFDVLMKEAYADLSISLSGDGAMKRLFRRFTRPFADVEKWRVTIFAAKAALKAQADADVVALPKALPAIAACAASSASSSSSSAAAPASAAEETWVSGELFDFEGQGAAACEAVAAASAATPALPSWLAPSFSERYNRLSFLVSPQFTRCMTYPSHPAPPPLSHTCNYNHPSVLN